MTTNWSHLTAEQRLTKARSQLILTPKYAFFGCLAMKMKLKQSTKVKHAATDGRSLIYNPEWIRELTLPEATAVFAKGTLKSALGHAWRGVGRDNKRWQHASDIVAHYILKQSGFVLPACDAEVVGRGDVSAEEVYGDLKPADTPPKNETEQEPQDGNGSGGGSGQEQGDPGEYGKEQDSDGDNENPEPGDEGEDQDGDGSGNEDGDGTESSCEVVPVEDEQEQKEQEAEWRGAMVEAASAAQGNMPGELKRIVESVMAPDLPWHTLLRDFVERTAKNDYDWITPSRRYLPMGLHMPSLRSEELPEVVIAIDTSGSIDLQRLSEFSAEASNVLEQYDTTIRVIYCDYDVQGEEVFNRQDLPMDMHPKGGGGTSFSPVFDYIREHGHTPACVIYFTDMCGRFPDKEVEWPTLWVTKKHSPKAPWGQTVFF